MRALPSHHGNAAAGGVFGDLDPGGEGVAECIYVGDDQDELEVVPDGKIRTRCAEAYPQPITALEITDVHPCEPVVLGVGAAESEETDENGIVTYIYKLDWNTLPFHNGEHELELKVTFTPDIGEPETIELKQNVDIYEDLINQGPSYNAATLGRAYIVSFIREAYFNFKFKPIQY